MQLPIQIQFQNTEPPEAAKAAIRKLTVTLDRTYPKIMTRRVRVPAP